MAEDLKVLCVNCHPAADEERRKGVDELMRQRRYEARYSGFMEKTRGEHWEKSDYAHSEESERDFEQWVAAHRRYDSEEEDFD